MKYEEMKTLEIDQLNDHIDDCRENLLKASFEKRTQSGTEKPHMIKKYRREIAQAMTLLTMKNFEDRKEDAKA